MREASRHDGRAARDGLKTRTRGEQRPGENGPGVGDAAAAASPGNSAPIPACSRST
ncbi:MAG: hypothetical protein AVDCRST_MAG70-1127 [uncultured Thermomicrobiales bacterium]|uniref:Uncharacterized protein n=1 Tax=uncultured Thermomicrobiales bacterium TaxID=1645740 RepID=A0A6J4UN61_9BACT|nr:MAG: hypothetical protein AVDCRST_MAG70-1127 [uncultured Thermomicrobiales bacterium]